MRNYISHIVRLVAYTTAIRRLRSIMPPVKFARAKKKRPSLPRVATRVAILSVLEKNGRRIGTRKTHSWYNPTMKCAKPGELFRPFSPFPFLPERF